MYSTITNPNNGKKVNLNSKMGKQIIRNYMTYVTQLGGAEAGGAAAHLSPMGDSNGITMWDKKVVTVRDESLHEPAKNGIREGRSNAMVDSFKTAVEACFQEKKEPISVEFFSAGASIYDTELMTALLTCISENKINKVIIAGTELLAEDVINLGKKVIESGSGRCRFLYVSGGADQYEVHWGGRTREGNMKTVMPKGAEGAEEKAKPKQFVAEEVHPASLFYKAPPPSVGAAATTAEGQWKPDEMDDTFRDFLATTFPEIGAYIVHNCPPESLRAVLDVIPWIGSSLFGIVHVVDRDDTVAMSEGRYGATDLIYSHGGMGTICLADVLVGGHDSGNPDHSITQQWVAGEVQHRGTLLGRTEEGDDS